MMQSCFQVTPRLWNALCIRSSAKQLSPSFAAQNEQGAESSSECEHAGWLRNSRVSLALASQDEFGARPVGTAERESPNVSNAAAGNEHLLRIRTESNPNRLCGVRNGRRTHWVEAAFQCYLVNRAPILRQIQASIVQGLHRSVTVWSRTLLP